MTRARVACPRLVRGAPCPNAAGLSGLCATHRAEGMPKPQRRAPPRPRRGRHGVPKPPLSADTIAAVLVALARIRIRRAHEAALIAARPTLSSGLDEMVARVNAMVAA